MKKALRFIQTNTEGIFKEVAKNIAHKAEKILNLSLTYEPLTAHSKGQGLICNKFDELK